MHAAEARRNDGNADLAGELIGAAGRALELEAQHAAEAGEQAAGARMPRMRLETGVIHPRDPRVPLEKLRDFERALVLVAHPEREGLESPAEQERRVRIERTAEVVGLVPDALDQLRAACDRARNDVRVAVQILGGTVDRKVEAGLDRAKVDGTRERGVDGGKPACG